MKAVPPLILIPALGALLSLGLAEVCPTHSPRWFAFNAVLHSAPRVWMALWPLWAFAVGVWKQSLRWPAAGAAVGIACMGLPPGPMPMSTGHELRLVFANVNAFSETPAETTMADLAALEPDVLVVAERRGDDVPGMTRVADNLEAVVDRESHRSFIHCRPGLDCQGFVTDEYGTAITRMPFALVRVAELCVVGLHVPPGWPFDSTAQPIYLDVMAEHVANGRLSGPWGTCRTGDPVVAIGDLNAVPGTTSYRRLQSLGLVDTLSRRGVFALSWPAGGGWPNLPLFLLDHFFVAPDLQDEVIDVRHRRVEGADHKAVVARLRSRSS